MCISPHRTCGVAIAIYTYLVIHSAGHSFCIIHFFNYMREKLTISRFLVTQDQIIRWMEYFVTALEYL